ncbi:MAG: carbohydrate kinase family protein [Anaerolineales bacterium]
MPDGKVYNDIPGGNALYSAIGWLVWQPQETPGIIARVGEDFPQSWFQDFHQHGIDTQGINIQSAPIDVRYFSAYSNPQDFIQEDAIVQYAKHEQPFPKALFGYQPVSPLTSRTRTQPTSLRSTDIPALYLNSTAAHIAPMDYVSHNLLPSILHQGSITTITLAPSSAYMNPIFWNDIPQLIMGLTAFLPTEEQVRDLFKERSEDIWEMAEALSQSGCDIIVIRKKDLSQFVYDGLSHKRWFIPPYPARHLCTHGATDVFCGGFLAGYRLSFDPLEAALRGNIAASIAAEGIGAFYALDAEPRLAAARLESLRQAVKKC